MRRLLKETGSDGDALYIMVTQLANISPIITKKIENVSNELLDLSNEVSRQNVESADWLLLPVFDKLLQEGGILEKKKKNKTKTTGFISRTQET